ncbi:MAG: YihY/virulence factor BrkB family protein [Gaiellaceae bacterium]
MARRTTSNGGLRRIVDLWAGLFAEHDLLTSASAIALQAFVAEVAIALLGLGLLAATGEQSVWNSQVGPQVQQRVLEGVFAGMDQTVQHIFQSDSAGLIIFAALLAIWEVSGAVRACMGALNRIYETSEGRPWWIRFPVSLSLSVGIILALIGSALLLLAERHAVHGAWGLPFAVVRWLGSIALLGLAFGLLVRFAPNERRAKKWVTAGAALVVIGWIIESLIFRWYVTSVANFKTAVGSLTVFLVMTSYLYVGSIILLVGIEVDELARRDAARPKRSIVELVRGFL